MPKQRVNGAESVDLTRLQSNYDKLSASLEEVRRLAETLDAGSTIDDQMLERREERIHEELHAIAKTIAAKESQDVSGASVKAKVLLDWCDQASDDVTSQLTVSLCRDVLRIARSGGSGERTG